MTDYLPPDDVPADAPAPEDSQRLSRLAGGAPRPAGPEAPAREKPKRSPTPRSYSTMRVTPDERQWATLAHASAWVSLAGGIGSGGLMLPLLVFVPLAIYFMFRNRSEFVAFHALQAFVLQLVGTVGMLALFVVGALVWLAGLVLSAVLMLVLVGFVLLPLWMLLGIVFLTAVVLLPFVGLAFGTVAAVGVWRGGDFRYPVVADWVDRQLAGGLLSV